MSPVDDNEIRLLLVEDNAGDARFLQELLKESRDTSFSVEHVSRLAEGVQCLGEKAFDIVLLDLSLPDGQGLDTVLGVRRAAPAVPIVVLTGFDDERFAITAVREGAQDYLVKGRIEPDLLIRSIRYAVERQGLQIKQRQQEQQIQKLASSVRGNPHPVFELAAGGELVYYNEAASSMAASLGKSSPAEILPPGHSRILRQCLDTRNPHNGVESEVAGRIISWSFFPLPDQDVVHAYAIEITERIRLEQQLRQFQKMEAIGQLAAGVAHDFNNFLSVIRGHIDLLEMRNPAPEYGMPLKQIRHATDSATELTRQLLMISRKQEIQQQVLNLSDTLERLAGLLTGILGRTIELRFEPIPALPPIFADPGLIDQIVINLAVNARDAMPTGGVLTLGAETASLVRPGQTETPPKPAEEFACITVSDTGTGMDPATLSRIYEPFFTTKPSGKGTGLGLATVYGIVDQHRGWIDVESEVGRGTTFRVFLPAAGENAAPGQA